MFKVGDVVVCIGKIIKFGDSIFYTSKWAAPIYGRTPGIVLFHPYIIGEISSSEGRDYLWFNFDISLGYDSEGFISLKEYRKQKLEKICLSQEIE